MVPREEGSEYDGISDNNGDNGSMRLQVRITTDDPSWLSHSNHPSSPPKLDAEGSRSRPSGGMTWTKSLALAVAGTPTNLVALHASTTCIELQLHTHGTGWIPQRPSRESALSGVYSPILYDCTCSPLFLLDPTIHFEQPMHFDLLR